MLQITSKCYPEKHYSLHTNSKAHSAGDLLPPIPPFSLPSLQHLFFLHLSFYLADALSNTAHQALYNTHHQGTSFLVGTARLSVINTLSQGQRSKSILSWAAKLLGGLTSNRENRTYFKVHLRHMHKTMSRCQCIYYARMTG